MLALMGVAAVAACGFEPLYGRHDDRSGPPLAAVEVAPIADRAGQVLRTHLITRLSPKGVEEPARYRLHVQLTESRQDLAVRKDEIATRANLILTANFQLQGAPQGAVLLKGSVNSTSSFNILASDFATLSAENDARARSLREISDEIRTRVAIYLAGSQ